MKSYSKAVANTNNPKTGFKTPNMMRPSVYSGGKQNYANPPKVKFNPGQFKTQHKG